MVERLDLTATSPDGLVAKGVERRDRAFGGGTAGQGDRGRGGAGPVRLPIAEAQGLMCAEEVVTEAAMPGFDQAAIDGYAVRSVDITAAET